jgi:V-ATPase subunit C
VRDSKFILYRVFVFSKTAAEFRTKLREARFIPRDLEGICQPQRTHEMDDSSTDSTVAPRQQHHTSPLMTNPQENAEDELQKLQQQVLMNFHYILSIVKTTYSETFTSFFHFKILKVFIEDVLRYGLPIRYTTFVLLPPPDKHKVDLKSLKQICLDFMQKYHLNRDQHSMNRVAKKKEDRSLATGHLAVSGILQEYTDCTEYLPFVLEDVKWEA